MIWLLTRVVVLPVKAAAGGFKLGFWTGKVLGYRRLLLVGIGIAVGLLVAPGPGAALRARLRERLDGGAAPVPAPPRPATPRVVPSPSPVPAPPSSGAPTSAGPAPAPPGPVDVVTALGGADGASEDVDTSGGGGVVAGPPTEGSVGVERTEPPASPEPAVDAEPLPAVPDADPAVEDEDEDARPS